VIVVMGLASRLRIATIAAVFACGGTTTPPADETIFVPYTDADGRVEGIAASNGQLLVVVSAARPDGVVAWARRLDAAGNTLGTTFLDASFFPKDIHDPRFPALRVVGTPSGWAFVDTDAVSVGFLDLEGNLETRPIGIADGVVGVGAISDGLATFRMAGFCGSSFCLARDHVTLGAPVASQSIALPPSQPLVGEVVGVEQTTTGGAIVAISMTDWSVSTLALDATATPVGSWSTTPALALVSAPQSPPSNAEVLTIVGGASRAGDHAVLVARTNFTYEILIAKADGSLVQGGVNTGPAFGFVSTPSGYRVTSECALGGCFLDFDADGVKTGETPLGVDGCPLVIPIASDDAGGRAALLCHDDVGLLVRTASLDTPDTWSDGFRVPGSVASMELWASPVGALAEVTPMGWDENYSRTTLAIPIDESGVSGAPVAQSFWRIAGPTPTGFLALGAGDPATVSFIDASANVSSTASLGANVIAAGWAGAHAIVATGGSSATNFSLVTPDGVVTNVPSTDASFYPVGFCPAAIGGLVLVQGIGGSMRRMTAGATWVDTAEVDIPTKLIDMKPFDCFVCGDSCWVVVSGDGVVSRLDASTGTFAATTVAQLPTGIARASGDVSGGLAGVADANGSLTLIALDPLGKPTGATWPSSTIGQHFALAALGDRRWIVATVVRDADGTERVVRRIMQL
jgi:hypothetical protein